jgi:hypothetical protein
MSFTFANLPGVQVATVDGGLAAVNTPTNQSVLVFGTSPTGPANSPFQVVSLSAAAKTFGLTGTLVRGMLEAATYCDNISLFRIGAAQGSITVGQTSGGSPTIGPTNTLISGTRLGGVISLVVSGHVTPDIIAGISLVVSGFLVNTALNATWTVTSVTVGGTNDTIVIDELGFADESTETVAATAHTTVPNPAQSGFIVTLGQVDVTANTRYSLWYKPQSPNGILSIWLDGSLVYSNDPSFALNTGDCSVTGTSTAGTAVGNQASDTLANAITIAAAVTATDILYTPPLSGIGLSGRALYIAQQNAMALAQGFPTDIVVVPGAFADQANVSYYVSGNSATATNNPTTNPDALDWLWTGLDVNNNPIYQWSTETNFYTWDNHVVSTAVLHGDTSPTTPVANAFTTPSARLAAGAGGSNKQPNGFHEVSFAYQLARFCAAQSEAPQADHGGSLGFIGTHGPANLSNFSLSSVKAWIGTLPTYDPITGFPTVSGTGLLGIPFLTGAAAGSLNTACSDYASGHRLPGLFTTLTDEYDGASLLDSNGFAIDNGAFISVQGDYALQTNAFGTYVGNIAGIVAGLTSSLDAKKAVTNKQVAGVSQLYRASLNQLDALTQANINMLRFKGQGQLPVSLHDKTAATDESDYTLALRQRIKFLMIQTVLLESQNFIGNGTNDGLSLTALKTALDADCLNLQKRGYISSYNFTITSTRSQQKIGQASIQVAFVPANELVQLNCTIGINING